MSTKRYQHRSSRRQQNHINFNNHHRHMKRPVRSAPQETKTELVQQFNNWCMSLRTVPTYEFSSDQDNKHRCKMTLPIFPNVQSIGDGAKTKKEAKANSIIAFLAHMEKRKQVGLFVPYMFPALLRNIQVELRRANVAVPDLNLNINEYLLADRMVSARQAKKLEKIIRTVERVCNVRIVLLWQATNITFIYIIGPKSKEDFIRPYVKALFQPDKQQMFNYGDKLRSVFSDEKFLDDVCMRLKVLCDNHLEKCKLFIHGSLVNVQYCYNEFLILRREFEKEFYRNRQHLPNNEITSFRPTESRTTSEPLESTRIDHVDDQVNPNEEKNTDQLPDYSVYDDDVNASMLRVLQNDEDAQAETSNQDVTITNKIPEVIEVSDDSSDSTDLQIVQTIEPTAKKRAEHIQPNIPCQNAFQVFASRFDSMSDNAPSQPLPLFGGQQPVRQPRILRHIVLDGQNIARNSNDYNGTFSWIRLSNAVNYFKNRGHQNIIAFLPLYCRDYSNKQLSVSEMNRERQCRDELINLRYIAFTPSRYHQGQRLTNYDDRFILQYAADNDGIVVSNDNFRDLQHEKNFQFVINNRILPFATINETFMPATDPLGRNGPNLDEFLSKPCL